MYYQLVGFHDFNNNFVSIELKRVGENLYFDGMIDNDFKDDEKWTLFCEQMKNLLELIGFDVPSWYYPN